MVVRQPSKLVTWVRFPSPAPTLQRITLGIVFGSDPLCQSRSPVLRRCFVPVGDVRAHDVGRLRSPPVELSDRDPFVRGMHLGLKPQSMAAFRLWLPPRVVPELRDEFACRSTGY